MICRPYKSCKLSDISQGFGINPQSYQPNGHSGTDFVSSYGTFLVSPELCKVVSITDSSGKIDLNTGPLERGFGIKLQSLRNPDVYYLYWHCLPRFPVNVGDKVVQGQIVAQMGNSGFVLVRGIPIHVNVRNIPPYLGTHLHIERRIEKNGIVEYTDITKFIDYSIPINYDILTAVKNILQKIINIINKK